MTRKKKRNKIKREFQKFVYSSSDTNFLKFDQIKRNCADQDVYDKTDQIEIKYHKYRRGSNCSSHECQPPIICISDLVYRLSKRYAKYVFYHEIGHAFLHFPYIINLELFDYDLYMDDVLFPQVYYNNAIRENMLQMQLEKLRASHDLKIWKGTERFIIRQRIEDIMNDFAIRNPKKYQLLITPFQYYSPSDWQEKIVNEFEAHIFAVVNLNQRNLSKTLRYAMRVYAASKEAKICTIATAEIVTKIMHDPLVKERLWIYKTHIVPNTERKK